MWDNEICFYINKNKIKENMDGFLELGDVFYPVKANSSKQVLKVIDSLLKDKKTGYLISYVDHYHKLRDIGVAPNKMELMNVIADDTTVRELYDKGVRFFTFDSLDDISKFKEYADLKNVKVSVRVSSMNVFSDIYTHLGASLGECKQILNELRECNELGISFYLNCDVRENDRALEKMLDFIVNNVSNTNIKFINIGGLDGYKSINKCYLDRVKRILNLERIILEPGKHLLEEAISLKTHIIKVKSINNINMVVIKNGIYSGLLDTILYNKKFKMYIKTNDGKKVNLSYDKIDRGFKFLVYGGSSDSRDFIGEMYIDSKYKNEIATCADLYIESVGTYFEEFFMNYGCDISIKYEVV